MTKRMLIDATHAEETRVVVLDGTQLEDFDVETSTKRQLKGNIYLAKVVRVEPSLQAAFVEYGGNRHGFLAFSEIHPDYYQIPVADRQRLIEMQAEEARREEEEDDLEMALGQASEPEPAPVATPPKTAPKPMPAVEAWALAATPLLVAPLPASNTGAEPGQASSSLDAQEDTNNGAAWAKPDMPRLLARQTMPEAVPAATAIPLAIERQHVNGSDAATDDTDAYESNGDHIETLPPPETVGGDQETGDDQRERRMPPRFLRNYKIQEVVRRRQILLIQVVKEERGTKGAALTTYLSLAGRFGVLMPNSPRGGGISRKITSATDRRRLKEVMAELDIPRGMGMIVRTAGANRPKPEIKRDCEYLLRLWDDIREHTMKSVAPALIYEEASLIKRAIRDVYSRDIDEILVDGEEGWRAAHDFMRMLMPTHAKKVQLWRDGGQPLFARNQVEAQLDGMLMPTVQLRSGGYLVINQAEALVAIDVNSGRSTRERNVEETALRTNLEAADEVARQLRLRDLAGLIVIDFIDMESKRHNAMVERRIKEALKNDRARIQVGHISHFGLLEMSRQRLRPSLAETSFIACQHCGGTGHVRSTENAAIHVLRGIEDEGGKRRSAEIIVHVATPVALYLLNHKRERLHEIEVRYAMRIIVAADDTQIAPQFRIEKVRTRSPDELPVVVTAERSMLPAPVEQAEDDEEAEAVSTEDEDDDSGSDADTDTDTGETVTGEQAAGATADESSDEAERRKKRRRRRRRGGRRDDQQPAAVGEPYRDAADGAVMAEAPATANGVSPHDATAIGTTVHDATADGAPLDGVTANGVAANIGVTAGDTADGSAVADAVAADFAGVASAETSLVTGGRAGAPPDASNVAEAAPGAPAVAEATAAAIENPPAPEDDPSNRRRGRRGGRRRRRDNEGELSPFAVPGADQPDLQPVYAGPTPADPFGGRAFDIFDVMDQAERAAEVKPAPRANAAAEIVSSTALEPDTAAKPDLVQEPHPAIEPGSAAPVEASSRPGASSRPRVSAEFTAEPELELAPGPEANPEPEALKAAEMVAQPAEVPEPQLTVTASKATPDQPAHDEPGRNEPLAVVAEESAALPTRSNAAVEAVKPAQAEPERVDAASPKLSADTEPAREIVNAGAPAPASEALVASTDAETAKAAFGNETPKESNEPLQSDLLIRPILVGADGEAPAEKKRGWWRR